MELFTNPWHRKRRRRRRRRNPDDRTLYYLGGAALLGLGYLLFRPKKEEEPVPEGFAEPVPSLTPGVNVDYETYPKDIQVHLEPRSRDQITVLADCSVLTVPVPWWEETAPALFDEAWDRGERNPLVITDEVVKRSLDGCSKTIPAVQEFWHDVHARVVREVSARGVPLEAHFEQRE